jgi:hypothetical protein
MRLVQRSNRHLRNLRNLGLYWQRTFGEILLTLSHCCLALSVGLLSIFDWLILTCLVMLAQIDYIWLLLVGHKPLVLLWDLNERLFNLLKGPLHLIHVVSGSALAMNVPDALIDFHHCFVDLISRLFHPIVNTF